jgi:uracil-DNA glycosylase family 4
MDARPRRVLARHGRDWTRDRVATARQVVAQIDEEAARSRRSRLAELTAEVVACRRCPRLVEWRERVAREKVSRFRDETYWGRPVPGFGDPDARILIVGLAPAAHGGNRTGRVFTGDASGDFLWAALHAVGLSNQPVGRRADDGLELTDTYVAPAVRCAPPANKPTPEERENCAPYLVRELAILDRVMVLIALGAYAWYACLRTVSALGHPVPSPKPRFGHGAEATVGPYTQIGTYHPSQQNTFTGVLTQSMLVDVLRRAQELAVR